jgi:hypothetical protein
MLNIEVPDLYVAQAIVRLDRPVAALVTPTVAPGTGTLPAFTLPSSVIAEVLLSDTPGAGARSGLVAVAGSVELFWAAALVVVGVDPAGRFCAGSAAQIRIADRATHIVEKQILLNTTKPLFPTTYFYSTRATVPQRSAESESCLFVLFVSARLQVPLVLQRQMRET